MNKGKRIEVPPEAMRLHLAKKCLYRTIEEWEQADLLGIHPDTGEPFNFGPVGNLLIDKKHIKKLSKLIKKYKKSGMSMEDYLRSKK